jgi:F-type H+-transporting ATPase subunit delta
VKRRRAATPYAKALFALARERDQAELVGRELADAVATFGSAADLRDFFARPWIPAAVKRAVATEVVQSSGFSKLTSDFLALVAERGRTDHLPAMVDTYQKFLDDDLHRVRAQVRTAVPLTEETRRGLSTKLEQALGGRRVLLEEVIDGRMLGGFIVESRGVVLDGSLDGQLERLRRILGQEEAAPKGGLDARDATVSHVQG